MFYVKTIGVTVARLVVSSNINEHMLALGSHPDYDAQGTTKFFEGYCLNLRH